MNEDTLDLQSRRTSVTGWKDDPCAKFRPLEGEPLFCRCNWNQLAHQKREELGSDGFALWADAARTS
jgi:hypothetical protein